MVRIAQITDTHLLAHKEDDMRGVQTWYSLKKVLETAKKAEPELILLTGDLAHDGEYEAYQHLKELIEKTAIPAYWLPGNHDNYSLMQSALSSQYLRPQKLFHHKNWCFILLNSCLETAQYGEGTFAQTELDWLAEELEANSNNPTAIAFHHHPVDTGIDWLEQMSVLNSTDFHQILAQHPQVKVVCFGHIHHQVDVEKHGVQFYGTPATCTQVTPAKKELIDGKIQTWQQPGFRLIELGENGKVTTEVHRIQWF
ncbi:metallophosphoesterase [[Leptolyngbya] sp. PCC 7376]|uniref:phosphodiesterase n=1 Tax=[Leptolyngbya] sp. PCC 7376 TaxID=111781 RepID=UPI00029EE2D9|nr:phosphodiesterase [[Leptolyngbya] sp. PCC 7376]AFY40484.1 metallophosphoesterase [[Leptolyngbya] sp. PCC 7376]